MILKKIVSGIAINLIVFFALLFLFGFVDIPLENVFGTMYDYSNDSVKESVVRVVVDGCEQYDAVPDKSLIQFESVEQKELFLDLCGKYSSGEFDERGIFVEMMKQGIGGSSSVGDVLDDSGYGGFLSFFEFLSKYSLLFIVVLLVLLVLINFHDRISLSLKLAKILIKVGYVFVVPFVFIKLYMLVWPVDLSSVLYNISVQLPPFDGVRSFFDFLVVVMVEVFTWTTFIYGFVALMLGIALKFIMLWMRKKKYEI